MTLLMSINALKFIVSYTCEYSFISPYDILEIKFQILKNDFNY